jgi:hypothetical protein
MRPVQTLVQVPGSGHQGYKAEEQSSAASVRVTQRQADDAGSNQEKDKEPAQPVPERLPPARPKVDAPERASWLSVLVRISHTARLPSSCSGYPSPGQLNRPQTVAPEPGRLDGWAAYEPATGIRAPPSYQSRLRVIA